MNKIEKIGSVELNYKFFDPSEQYNDGDYIEKEMLEISKNASWNEHLKKSEKWPILYHFSEIRWNILEWYPFDSEGTILEIGSGCGALSGMFCKKVKRVVAVELSERRSMISAYRNRECDNLEIILGNFNKMHFTEKFDYITLIGVLEYAACYIEAENPYEALINKAKDLLKPNGKIIIAIENKMGMKYLNGAKEDHLGVSYAGIEDYLFSNIRTFTKPELEAILHGCGENNYRFYYPYPDYKLPETIYSDSNVPQPGEIRLWGKNYDMPRIAMYNDAIFADQICSDNMFAYFANSFLVITNESNSDISLAHYTNTRLPMYQTRTIIKNKSFVEKDYLKTVDRKYDILKTMQEKYEELQNEFPEIEFLHPYYDDHMLRYEFVDGYSLENSVFIYRHDPEKLIKKIRSIWDGLFSCKSEFITEFRITDEYKNILGDKIPSIDKYSYKVTNLDMLLHNLIIFQNKVYCIDYEWIVSFPVPRKFILFRLGMDFWEKYNMYLSKCFYRNDFLTEIGIDREDMEAYYSMYDKFSEYVYGNERYLGHYAKNRGTISVKGL